MKTVSSKSLSKIGIGTWGVGGLGHRDTPVTEKVEDKKYTDALVYSLEKGINFTEIALGYGHGQALALFKKALDESNIVREDVFLTHSLYPRDLPSIQAAEEDTRSFYQTMETDYADSTLITQSFIIKFGEKPSYELLHKLLVAGKTRFVSLSNASPKCIRAFKKEFGDKFYAHEGHISFEIRAVQDKGVFDTCDELGVKNIIWRPLRRSSTFTHNWELLVELADKYSKYQSQIILNWMCHLGYSPMVFSMRKNHIDENVASTEFQMSEEDYKRMTDFRPSNYHPPKVDWEHEGSGDSIVTLVSDFEKHIGQ